MEDFIGVIVLILIAVISSSNKRKKLAQKKSAPKRVIIPYEKPSAVPDPAQPVANDDTLCRSREAQLQKEMQEIRETVREELAEKKAEEGKAAVQTPPRKHVEPTVHTRVKARTAPKVQPAEGVDPCHDGFYAGDEAEQSEYLPDQPQPLAAMEGVDPCHDELYANESEPCESDAAQTDNRAAQEILRGVIFSEVLTRPTNRWRTQRR